MRFKTTRTQREKKSNCINRYFQTFSSFAKINHMAMKHCLKKRTSAVLGSWSYVFATFCSFFELLNRTVLDSTISFGSPGPEDITQIEVMQQGPPRDLEHTSCKNMDRRRLWGHLASAPGEFHSLIGGSLKGSAFQIQSLNLETETRGPSELSLA